MGPPPTKSKMSKYNPSLPSNTSPTVRSSITKVAERSTTSSNSSIQTVKSKTVELLMNQNQLMTMKNYRLSLRMKTRQHQNLKPKTNSRQLMKTNFLGDFLNFALVGGRVTVCVRKGLEVL